MRADVRIKGTFIYGELVYDELTGTFSEVNRREEPFDIEWPDEWLGGETAKRGRN